MGKIEGENAKSLLMEKWTENEKINKGCFLSGKDMLFTQLTLTVLQVREFMVKVHDINASIQIIGFECSFPIFKK